MYLWGSFWKRLTLESVDYAEQIALVQLWRVLSKAKSLNKREFTSVWRFSPAVKVRLDLRPLAVLVVRPLDCRSWDFLVSIIVWAHFLLPACMCTQPGSLEEPDEHISSRLDVSWADLSSHLSGLSSTAIQFSRHWLTTSDIDGPTSVCFHHKPLLSKSQFKFMPNCY